LRASYTHIARNGHCPKRTLREIAAMRIKPGATRLRRFVRRASFTQAASQLRPRNGAETGGHRRISDDPFRHCARGARLGNKKQRVKTRLAAAGFSDDFKVLRAPSLWCAIHVHNKAAYSLKFPVGRTARNAILPEVIHL
jgi:hypothetical protein